MLTYPNDKEAARQQEPCEFMVVPSPPPKPSQEPHWAASCQHELQLGHQLRRWAGQEGREGGGEGTAPSTPVFKGLRKVTAASKKCHMAPANGSHGFVVATTTAMVPFTPGSSKRRLPRTSTGDGVRAEWGSGTVVGSLPSKWAPLTSFPFFPFSTPAKPAVTQGLCEPTGHKQITEVALAANKLMG